jgi:hypothetical protein
MSEPMDRGDEAAAARRARRKYLATAPIVSITPNTAKPVTAPPVAPKPTPK